MRDPLSVQSSQVKSSQVFTSFCCVRAAAPHTGERGGKLEGPHRRAVTAGRFGFGPRSLERASRLSPPRGRMRALVGAISAISVRVASPLGFLRHWGGNELVSRSKFWGEE